MPHGETDGLLYQETSCMYVTASTEVFSHSCTKGVMADDLLVTYS
jgi:hypothetical protein